MKRFSVLAISMLIIFALSSCEVHLGTQSYDVPWWFNALTVLVVCVPICVVAGFRISKNKYLCPKCGQSFHPKWWQGAFSIHVNSDRVFKCPHCGRRGFCKKRWLDEE